jgi:hypothetical protein
MPLFSSSPLLLFLLFLAHQPYPQCPPDTPLSNEFLELFKEEISYSEELSLSIVLVDAFSARDVLGRATVNLSQMLDYECSLLKLETDIYADEKEEEQVGTVVVDVRGWQMLLRAKRS